MNRLKLQDLKREAVKMRRKLDKTTDRQEKERALKTYAKLLHEIIEIRKFEAENPVMLIRSE
jgi:hypothetical protein